MKRLPSSRFDAAGDDAPPARTRPRLSRCLGLALSACYLALFAAPVGAQPVLTLRQGQAWVESSDLRLETPRGTDVLLRDVAWLDDSYRSPIYFGIGLTWWLPRHLEWGIGLDVTHAKARLDGRESVLASGRLDGAPIDRPVITRDVIRQLELSHGLNLATVSGYRRWLAAPHHDLPQGVALYLGLGGGVAVPHVAADLGGARTDRYQLAGPAARGVVGLDVPFDENVSLVGEAILSWADLHADLAGGGSFETRLLVPQLSLGIALRD
jgi:lipid A oxidase